MNILIVLADVLRARHLGCHGYTHNTSPHMDRLAADGVFLRAWESANLFHLDEYVRQCRDLFLDKPVVLGCYLRDYPADRPVTRDRLRHQWERLPGYLEEGLVDGY